ncbi:Ig-like domain-containing protein [Actinoplanes sp. NPDC049599]|uniref:Ig-like domain-containing protein n=1 Tax=Actinoplanes sp. NPDC049599 TaxID=3363903 RepID=UPI0037BA7CB5
MKSNLTALLRTTRAAAAMALVAGVIVVVPASLAAAVGDPAPLVISEFRVRGPSGANDEFIEIANTAGSPHTVAAASGAGYGVAASDGTTRCTIPDGTVIPGHGHYLCVNSVGYSLASYPSGIEMTATGDATYATDIPDNAGISLFNNDTGGGSYDLANRLDAVGSTSEANTLYKEGAGYPAITPFSIDYSFYRSLSTGTIAGRNQIDTATPGIPKDTNDNAADLVFVDTNGTSAGAGQRLGAPGPEDLSSPVSGDGLTVSLLNDCVSESAAPNVISDETSDPANNSTFGTITYRRTVTNNTDAPITLLRIRVADIRTFPAPSGVADLRPRNVLGGTATVDHTSCGGTSSDVPVVGTTLQEAPSQPNGGGFNSSLSVTLAQPLAPAASVNVNIRTGVQQKGINGVRFITEALPGAGTGTPTLTCAGASIAGTGASYCNLAPPTISAPSASAVLTNGAVTVSGNGGESDATVTATFAGPAPAVTESTCTSSVGSGGSWSCSPSSPLVDGSYSVTVNQADAASNTSVNSASVSFTIDSAAPAAPAVSAPSTGASLTNGAVTVSGNGGESDATVTATFVGPAPAVTESTCTSSVGSGGSWSCSPSSPLVDGSYSVTVNQADAASNTSVNSASVPFTVNAAAPTAPTGVSTVAGDRRLTITFIPPTYTGSAPITSYQISVDGGDTWSTLATSTGTGDTRVASLTNLQNGVPYALRLRAVNGFATGPASLPTTGTPVAPTPPIDRPAPAGVTATAGTASLTVSWAAVPGATGYTATASPGPATCTSTGTSCVLGAVAGTSYTVTVTANGQGWSSPASGASNAVTPKSPDVPAAPPDQVPTTLTTDKGQISLAVPGQQITVIGTGFAPRSTATIILYSTPIALGTVVTDANGSFSVPVTIPAGLDPGDHTFLASGVNPAGATRQMALPVTVAPTRTGSTGDGSDSQNTTIPVPANGLITLLDREGMPTTTVTVAQGTYALDATTGAITFVPVTGFVGRATPVAYRITDTVGSVVNGSYTATVTTGGGEDPGPSPSTGSSKVVIARLAVTRGLPRRATLPAIVSFIGVTKARNTAVLWSTVSGKRVILGTGRAAMTVASRRAAVTIVLNPLGRAMAATPGGYPVAVAMTTVPAAGGRTLRASGRTRLVLNQFTVPRAVYFATGSASITAAQDRYLAALRTRLTGVRIVTCVGHTDGRGNNAAGLRLGKRRAQQVCRDLTVRLRIRTSVLTQGESNPSGNNSTSAGMARNRRVDITIHY